MKKLEVFLSDFIGFIPNTISESIAEGTIVESLVITLFVILVSVLSVEGLAATRLYGFRSRYILLKKKVYLAAVKELNFATTIVATVIILIICFAHVGTSGLENVYLAIIYGIFTPVIYGVLKYFYLKRKYEKKYGKFE